MFGSQAGAECGKLCDKRWWKAATDADVQAELDAGADVMIQNRSGNTPLHYAVRSGTPAHIQALLDAGADVMALNRSGNTPLDSASTADNIQTLLTVGADVMARDKDDWTPLLIRLQTNDLYLLA